MAVVRFGAPLEELDCERDRRAKRFDGRDTRLEGRPLRKSGRVLWAPGRGVEPQRGSAWSAREESAGSKRQQAIGDLLAIP